MLLRGAEYRRAALMQRRDEYEDEDGHDFEPLDEEDDLFDDDDEEDDDDDGDDLDEEDDDGSLDDDFPLGDGVADTEATVLCPYCGEAVEIALDAGGGASQQYVEDCAVCCQPWRVTVSYDGAGGAYVSVAALDE
jgi:hypothetical protein